MCDASARLYAGLEAETGGGWCPSSARLAISGIEVGAAIYGAPSPADSAREIRELIEAA